MPNKTIYIAEDDMAIFQKAQEVAGESISKVIVQALQQYVALKEALSSGFKEYEVLRGYQGEGVNVEKARFIGKRLSGLALYYETEPDEYVYTLYLTRKGQFMLQLMKGENFQDKYAPIDYEFEVIEDFSKLYTKGLPSKLIEDAEKQLGKEHIMFLDI